MLQLDWQNITTSILSSALVSGGLVFILKKWIIGLFNKDMEDYKNEIQKKLLRHKIVTEENIKIYNKMYESLEISYGAASKILSRLSTTSDWSHCNKEDIEKYLLGREATGKKISDITSLYETDKPEMTKQLNDYIRILDHSVAEEKKQDAKNLLILKGIWMSDAIEKLIEKFINEINSCLVDHSMYIQGYGYEFFNKGADRFEGLLESLKGIKAEVRIAILEGK